MTSQVGGACALLLVGGLALGTATAQPSPSEPGATTGLTLSPGGANGLGPRIQFASREPNFGRVSRGETVTYTYVFTNSGDRVLHVLNVQPGCGCTHAGEWTKVVDPGKTGAIPIQLATANFQGDVVKSVTVSCDDPSLPNGVVQLQLKGNIWSPVEVVPQYLNFGIPYGAQGGSAVAAITNHLEEPLYVSAPQSSNPGFQVALKTNVLGRSYALVVSRVPPLTPGAAQTTISLKSSLTNPPSLSLNVWANVQSAVTLAPAQLILPAEPATNPVPRMVSIQNATTNHLVLSDPTVSAKSVKVELKEVQPGRYVQAVLTFPPGFDIPAGQRVEFSVKSNIPEHPLLLVPIVQLPKAARPPRANSAQVSAAPPTPAKAP